MTSEILRSPEPDPARGRAALASAGPRLPRLRTHLVALVLAVLLPALAFGAIGAWEALRRQDVAEEGRLMDTARVLAAAVDSLVQARVAALQVLAASPDAGDPPRWMRLERHARDAGAIFGAGVSVVERDGRVAFDTALPPDAAPGLAGAPGPEGDGVAMARAFETRQPVLSDLVAGRVGGTMTVHVYVPVIRDGVVQRLLGMPLLPRQLSATLARQQAEERGAATLTDGRGVIVARSREVEQTMGQSRPVREDAGPAGESGVLRGKSIIDGSAIRIGYHRLASAPGWHVWVNEPEASFIVGRRGPLLALLAGALLVFAIGLAAAVALTRRLLRPVEALVARAESVVTGRMLDGRPVPETPPAAVAEFERLRCAVADAEAALRRVQRIGRVGGFDIDLRTGVNRRYAEYMLVQGRELAPAQERHEDWVRRLHPEDRERAERHFLEAIADGASDTDYEQEYRIVTPDGEVRWIYARAEIERDASGRALRMVGAHVDVTALKAAEAALRDSEERLRMALEAVQLGAWEVDYRTGKAKRTPRTLEIFGHGPDDETGTYPSWRDRVHPDDRARLTEAVDSVRTGRQDAYRIEYRFLRPDGRWIWVESHGRAAGADAEALTGKAARLIGTTQDITARKQAEESQAVLVHELDHRAKNTLAVVQAALRLTPRTDAAAFAEAVEGRVNALARAHTLLAKGRWHGADLSTVAADALAPFLGTGEEGPRASFRGPPTTLSPAAVQALSMTFHELATNAAKHGALSVPSGLVGLEWERAGTELRITWTETGGPPVATEPARRGFGSSLIRATMAHQLGGRIRAEWRPSGLVWEARLPIERLGPSGGTDREPDLPGEAEAAGDEAAPEPAPAA
jgi:PAS domain S-box-containing protein